MKASIKKTPLHYMRDAIPSLLNKDALSDSLSTSRSKAMKINLDEQIILCFTGHDDLKRSIKVYVHSHSLMSHFQNHLMAETV